MKSKILTLSILASVATNSTAYTTETNLIRLPPSVSTNVAKESNLSNKNESHVIPGVVIGIAGSAASVRNAKNYVETATNNEIAKTFAAAEEKGKPTESFKGRVTNDNIDHNPYFNSPTEANGTRFVAHGRDFSMIDDEVKRLVAQMKQMDKDFRKPFKSTNAEQNEKFLQELKKIRQKIADVKSNGVPTTKSLLIKSPNGVALDQLTNSFSKEYKGFTPTKIIRLSSDPSLSQNLSAFHGKATAGMLTGVVASTGIGLAVNYYLNKSAEKRSNAERSMQPVPRLDSQLNASGRSLTVLPQHTKLLPAESHKTAQSLESIHSSASTAAY